jgi:hypothetical protein
LNKNREKSAQFHFIRLIAIVSKGIHTPCKESLGILCMECDAEDLVKTHGDIQKALDLAGSIPGVEGVPILIQDKLGAWGNTLSLGIFNF